jgi:hypothetical protein
VQIGFKHSTKEWDQYITKVREKFPEKVKTLVAQTTQNLSRRTKEAVPVRYSAIRQSVRPKVKDYHGQVTIRTHYAPYVEFGTGRLVRVPGELKDYAMQFKGKGIRQVNRRTEPYFYPNFFDQRDNFFKELEKALKEL